MVDRQLEPGFGRDGISGMVTPVRALRLAGVRRPAEVEPIRPDNPLDTARALAYVVARASGRRLRQPPATL